MELNQTYLDRVGLLSSLLFFFSFTGGNSSLTPSLAEQSLAEQVQLPKDEAQLLPVLRQRFWLMAPTPGCRTVNNLKTGISHKPNKNTAVLLRSPSLG